MPTAEPLATIIVPTFNRPGYLRRCLDALTRLSGPAFAVIVVDDGSAHPAAPVCAEFADRLAIQCHRQVNQGPGIARNSGAQAATTPFLLFTDDDCMPDPGWLAAMVEALEQSPSALAGGPVHNGLANNPYAAASQDIQSYLYATDTSGLGFFASNNLACSRDAFLKAGGFSSALRRASEDRELSIRWQALGWQRRFVERGVVNHFHDLSLRSFWKQHFNYGRGAKDLARLLQTGSGGPKLRPRGPAFYLGLLVFPLRQQGRLRPYRTLLAGLAQVATACGFYLSDRRD